MTTAVPSIPKRQRDGVRKRAPNACTRCRDSKVRCSGSQPCTRCTKRKADCCFDEKQQKVLVTKGFLTELEERARRSSHNASSEIPFGQHGVQDAHLVTPPTTAISGDGSITRHDSSILLVQDDDMDDLESETEESQAVSMTEERPFTNPLISSNTTHTAFPSGRPSYLGTSSNWSFGRRILTMVHEKVYGQPPPANSLLFEGATYDLGWSGMRSPSEVDQIILPTADFALFLINAVKFHCGQLFHLFDEELFFQKFTTFHASSAHADGGHDRDLWYVHYVLVLALGKAFNARVGKDRTPPGAELYVHAMKLLPDITYLCTDPLQSIEILCCAALYLQCLDMRSAAYNLMGQAMRICVIEGLHADVKSPHYTNSMLERCREIWWTVFVLDCHMSSLMGTPLALNERDVTARLPSFGGSSQKSLALGIHVKLAKTTASILQTVYSKEGRMVDRFIVSIKETLRELATINDERDRAFPMRTKTNGSSISRLGAYLHLFHHTCIILTTRPLLFAFWQRRLERDAPRRVSSAGGVRSLLRVCVASAQNSLKILSSLQEQGLLESFIPFDLESLWSSALVLLVSSAVDPSLLRGDNAWLKLTYALLDEMITRGNLVARYRKEEFEQMELSLKNLATTAEQSHNTTHSGSADITNDAWAIMTQNGSATSDTLQEWNSEDGLNGAQLTALADSLNFEDLDWLNTAEPFDHLTMDMQL